VASDLRPNCSPGVRCETRSSPPNHLPIESYLRHRGRRGTSQEAPYIPSRTFVYNRELLRITAYLLSVAFCCVIQIHPWGVDSTTTIARFPNCPNLLLKLRSCRNFSVSLINPFFSLLPAVRTIFAVITKRCITQVPHSASQLLVLANGLQHHCDYLIWVRMFCTSTRTPERFHDTNQKHTIRSMTGNVNLVSAPMANGLESLLCGELLSIHSSRYGTVGQQPQTMRKYEHF